MVIDGRVYWILDVCEKRKVLGMAQLKKLEYLKQLEKHDESSDMMKNPWLFVNRQNIRCCFMPRLLAAALRLLVPAIPLNSSGVQAYSIGNDISSSSQLATVVASV
jgi:hypothetical protein